MCLLKGFLLFSCRIIWSSSFQLESSVVINVTLVILRKFIRMMDYTRLEILMHMVFLYMSVM